MVLRRSTMICLLRCAINGALSNQNYYSAAIFSVLLNEIASNDVGQLDISENEQSPILNL